jgi:hypothetical protein
MTTPLEVCFGKRWLDPSAHGWLYTATREGEYLYVYLNYPRLVADRKAQSITRARWRYKGREYQTVMTSLGLEQKALVVKARRANILWSSEDV